MTSKKLQDYVSKLGFLDYALENYTDINDIRRIVVNTHLLNKDQLINFLCCLEPEKAKLCLQDIIKASAHNTPWLQKPLLSLGEAGIVPKMDIIKMFDAAGSIDGMFLYLRQDIATQEDKDVVFKYIEAAAKLNKLPEVEAIIRESKCYESSKSKRFLDRNETYLILEL